VGFEMASTLGEELARLRQVKGRTLSLREVERQTGISNEYLSQLERGVATKPAPDVLQKLAKFYGAPYEALLIAAGYLKEKSAGKDRHVFPHEVEAVARTARFSGEEWEEVRNFMTYLATKRKLDTK
jgi:transcriptional regulator with XRE-family HTH domain